MEKKFEVVTPSHIIAANAIEGDYPGIQIETPNGALIAAVEYDETYGGLRVVVWDDVANEEPSHIININEDSLY